MTSKFFGLGTAAASIFVSFTAFSEPSSGGKPFRLRIGDSMKIEGPDLRLGFADVTGDSRCPKNVQCVRAGEATVVLWLETDSGERTELSFAVPPGGGARQTYRDATIRILGLEPQTESGKRIARDDYIVEVAVDVEAR